jgi:fermentation-respiration switch protein FrsA (DUF1100 family)
MRLTGAATLVGLAGLVLLALWSAQRRFIYFPFGEVSDPATAGVPNADQVTFTTDDGVRLQGWFVRPAARKALATVIVFNGNAGNRAFRAPLGAALSHAGLSVLLFDYRGYGGSDGRPSEAGLALDAIAARRYVLSRADVNPRTLVYFGESLGTGVAVRLAAEHPALAVILRSAFTSLADVGSFHYPFLPVKWGLRDKFRSLDFVQRITSPLLVIAAEHDSVVPSELSRRLYEAARQPKRLLVLPGVDHNDYELLAGGRVIGEVVSFVSDAITRSQAGTVNGPAPELERTAQDPRS